MLKATPLLISALEAESQLMSALEAENQARFEEIVQEKIESWMLRFRKKMTFAEGYMPGNKLSQKSTRGAFVAALKRTIGKYRPEGADGLATGSWQLPCGLTASQVYAFVRDRYDALGIEKDAEPPKPRPKWDGRVVERIHVQRQAAEVRILPIASKSGVSKKDRPEEESPCFVDMSIEDRMYIAWWNSVAPEAERRARYICFWKNALRSQELALLLKAAKRPPQKVSRAQNPEKVAHRKALKAEALAAAENRGHAITLGVMPDVLGKPKGKAVIRKARKRDAEGNFVVDSCGRPVWEVQLISAESSSEEDERRDYVNWWQNVLAVRAAKEPVTVLPAACTVETLKEVFCEPPSPMPEPWVTEKPETKPASSKFANKLAVKLTQGENNGRNKSRPSDQKEAAASASAESVCALQDTEARRQARSQEWYQNWLENQGALRLDDPDWCQQNAAMIQEMFSHEAVAV